MRWIVLLLISCGLFMLIGCSGNNERQAPIISGAALSGATLTQGALPCSGGEVTFSATISANIGVQHAWVAITQNGNAVATVDLVASGNLYQGNWNVPANPNVNGQSVIYQAEIHASTPYGMTSISNVVTIIVNAANPPPGGPGFQG